MRGLLLALPHRGLAELLPQVLGQEVPPRVLEAKSRSGGGKKQRDWVLTLCVVSKLVPNNAALASRCEPPPSSMAGYVLLCSFLRLSALVNLLPSRLMRARKLRSWVVSAASSSSSSEECAGRVGDAGVEDATGSMELSNARRTNQPLCRSARSDFENMYSESPQSPHHFAIPRIGQGVAGGSCARVRRECSLVWWVFTTLAQMLRKKYVNQAVVLADSFDRRYSPITVDFPRVAAFFRCFCPSSHTRRAPVACALG